MHARTSLWVLALVGTIIQIGAATYGNCALFDNGDLRCWGHNGAGNLGIGDTNHIGDAPGEMPPANTNYGAGTIVELIGGLNLYSVLLADGSVRNWGSGVLLMTVRCWGENAYGQLGIGNMNRIGDGPGEMPPAVTMAY